MATGRRQWSDPVTQRLLGRAQLQLAESDRTLAALEQREDEDDRPSLESIEESLDELKQAVRDKEPTLPEIKVVVERSRSEPAKFSIRSPLGRISAKGRWAVTAAVLVVAIIAVVKALF